MPVARDHAVSFLRFLMGGWLVFPGDHAETDAQTIPGVDGCHRQGQIDQFLIGEALPDLVVDAVRHVVLADQSYRFGPGKSRTLTICEEGRFAPRIKCVQTLFRFAAGPRILAMHVEAIGTAVDLRGAHFNQCQSEGSNREDLLT